MHVLHITSDNNRTQNLINFYSNREKNYLAFSQFIYVIFQKTLNTCLWSLFAVFVFFHCLEIVWVSDKSSKAQEDELYFLGYSILSEVCNCQFMCSNKYGHRLQHQHPDTSNCFKYNPRDNYFYYYQDYFCTCRPMWKGLWLSRQCWMFWWSH